jgi:hypothetical protein
VCQLIPQSAMASDMASVNPLRSASSARSAAPAWLTKFFPSGITLARRTERLLCTFKELSSWLVNAVVVTVILPGMRAFYANAPTTRLVVERIIEV